VSKYLIPQKTPKAAVFFYSKELGLENCLESPSKMSFFYFSFALFISRLFITGNIYNFNHTYLNEIGEHYSPPLPRAAGENLRKTK
jgi:hypothetical protein